VTLNGLPRFAPFPRDGRCYRLVSLGHLNRNPRVRTHPTVRVWVTPLRKRSFEIIDYKNPWVYEARDSRVIELGIGTWPVLKVGTIWQNGRITKSPKYEQARFHDIGPSELVSGPVFADAVFTPTNSHGARPFLPFSAYPFPIDRKTSRVLILRAIADITEEPVTLIIFCAEIARFFFFSSTAMTEILLSGERLTHHLYGVYDPKLTFWDRTTGHSYVRLRQRIKDVEAPFACLFGTSQYAHRSAENIFESLLRNRAACGHASIDCYPPFEDLGVWHVRGKSMNVGSQKFFLVFSIDSCSAEFPFDQLFFSRDNDNSPGKKIDTILKESGYPQRWQKRKSVGTEDSETEEEEPVLRFDEEPCRFDGPTAVSVGLNGFTKLDPKKIDRLEKDEVHYRRAGRNCTSDEVKDYGMGRGGWWESKLSPLEFTRKNGEPESVSIPTPLTDHLKRFLAMLTILKEANIAVQRIQISNGEIAPLDGLSYLEPLNGWCYIDRRVRRRRRAIIAGAVFEGWNFYLIELERRPKRPELEEKFASLILHQLSGQAVEKEMLRLILKCCAENKGVSIDEHQFDLVRKRIIHQPTIAASAAQFYRYFVDRTSVLAKQHSPTRLSPLFEAA
jgi:hypothetical protein